jgi:hypothetical protein
MKSVTPTVEATFVQPLNLTTNILSTLSVLQTVRQGTRKAGTYVFQLNSVTQLAILVPPRTMLLSVQPVQPPSQPHCLTLP